MTLPLCSRLDFRGCPVDQESSASLVHLQEDGERNGRTPSPTGSGTGTPGPGRRVGEGPSELPTWVGPRNFSVSISDIPGSRVLCQS